MAVQSHQPHRVFLKEHWDDEWESQSDDGLYCDWCKLACSPDVNEAQLSRVFGPAVLGANQLLYVNRNPLDIEGHYVKVEIAQDAAGFFTQVKTWVGVVVHTVENRWGRQGISGEIGRQIFECRGLEYLLQRSIVDTSAVFAGGSESSEVDIGRGIGFNQGAGHGNENMRIGNRSDSLGGNDAYIFAATIGDAPYTDADAKLWSGSNIVRYLLNYHPPKDRTGASIVPFVFIEADGTEVLEKIFPVQEAHGKSVKTILDEVIDRRRIMTWWLETRASDDRAEIKLATFNKTSLTLPSGQVVPANPNQTTLYTDDDGLMVSFETVKDDTSHFHQVIARGEPLGSCFTITNEEDCFEADWDAGLRDEYENGASNAPGYGALEDWEKDSSNQAYRNTDKFLKVYRYFRVPPAWDGQSSGQDVFPNPAGGEALPFWYPGLRFKGYLPLLTETDYTAASSVTSETLEGSKPEYRRPFAVIYDQEANGYYHLDKMSYGHGLNDGLRTNGRAWSAHLRMQDDAFGVIIDVSGTYQHVLAGDSFTPADAYDLFDTEEALDWQKIYCTVFCELDAFAEAKYPETIEAEDDVIKLIYVRVPNARLDYLSPETIIGVDHNGALERCPSGGYVRDDREKLKDVARSSYEWYSTPRRSVNATVRSLITTLSLGDLITNVGSVNTQVVSNSVVTMIRFDLLANTTTIQTQFAQLDLTAF